jgi:hypothetical protein
VSPKLLAQYPSPNTVFRKETIKAERVGESIVAFTTREKGSGKVEHWLAVGGPEASRNNIRCGRVDLYSVAPSSRPSDRGTLVPRSCEAGMRFGDSLAVVSGKCIDSLCPKERVWIAVGSPKEAAKRGSVRLWNVWANGESTSTTHSMWAGSNENALYGKHIVPVRAREKGGGFLVVAKRGELPVVERPGAFGMRSSGYAQVRFNTAGTSEWTSWTRTLSPGTGADTPPANR